MKQRKPLIKFKPPKVQVTNEEIMRDLLFPAAPNPSPSDRNSGRR
jgi:hypothetical protein